MGGVQGSIMVAGVLFAVVGTAKGPDSERTLFRTSCVALCIAD